MIVALAIPVGILAGLLAGGRVDRLASIRLRWGRVAVAALLGQVVLFALPTGAALEMVGPAAYVATTAVVFVVLLANIRVPGAPVIALGAASNLAAVVANGGFMPTTTEALARAGTTLPDGFSNSVVRPDPALQPLTDVFAIPAGVPLATVFSVGDVLIAIGLVIALVLAMRPEPDLDGISRLGDPRGARS